jgi:uncharacterized protein
MKLAGAVDIMAPPRTVWEHVLDPMNLAACVPGSRGVRKVDDRTIEGSITVAVGPMEADFSFTSLITRSDFPDLVVEMTGVDSMTKSTLSAEIAVVFDSDEEARTRMRYEAIVQTRGRLSILGDIVLRATAGAMVDKVARCLQARLAPIPDSEV